MNDVSVRLQLVERAAPPGAMSVAIDPSIPDLGSPQRTASSCAPMILLREPDDELDWLLGMGG